MGYLAVRIIALSNGSGELQSCDRNSNEQCKDFFHGDSSLIVLVSLPLSAGSDRILPVRTSLFIMRIIVFAGGEIGVVARNAITSIGAPVARNATGVVKPLPQTPQSAPAPRAIPEGRISATRASDLRFPHSGYQAALPLKREHQ